MEARTTIIADDCNNESAFRGRATHGIGKQRVCRSIRRELAGADVNYMRARLYGLDDTVRQIELGADDALAARLVSEHR
jgi:hypothetical protein